MLAPVGCSRLMHPGGEVVAARAAGEAEAGYILLTASDVVVITAIEGITCAYRYYFVSVNRRGAKVTGEVGTCAEADDMRKVTATLSHSSCKA